VLKETMREIASLAHVVDNLKTSLETRRKASEETERSYAERLAMEKAFIEDMQRFDEEKASRREEIVSLQATLTDAVPGLSEAA